MEVSFASYITVTFALLLILWMLRRRKRDEYYMDDRADLYIIIGCIVFWPFLVSVVILGITLFICSIPIIAIMTLVSWLISVFSKKGKYG